MSWNLIYYASFNDIVNDDRIDIYFKQENFSGEPSALLLDAKPLTISYPGKDFYEPLFGCGCEINIINNTGNYFQYETLFNYPEKSNYIEIIKTPKSGDPSIYLFQGYILPDMYTSTLEKNIKVTIPGTDRLNTLDRYTPTLLVDTSLYRSDEYINAFDLIGNILIDSDVTDLIAVHNDLENINYRKSDDSSAYMKDVIIFVGKGGIGDGATITVDGLSTWWEYDEFGGIYKGIQNYITQYDASFAAKNINITIDSSNSLAFTSEVLGKKFTPDSSVAMFSSWGLNAYVNNITGYKNYADTVFNNVFLQADNFAAKNTIENDKICLEKILKTFYSRCYYRDGKWVIERVSDMGKQIKDFVVTRKVQGDNDPDITVENYDNTRIDLGRHDIINKSLQLTYDPGVNKIVLKLNYKEPDSLVENYFYDLEYYNNPTLKTSTKPLPKQRRWMMSETDASLKAVPYNDINISSGIWMYPKGSLFTWPAKYIWFGDRFASTKFTFTPDPVETILNVKYNLSFKPGDIVYDKAHPGSINAPFALRACDQNGKDWWIAKSNPADTSTYWKSSVYLFNPSTGSNDIIDDDYKWSVAETINISQPIITDVSIMQHQVPYKVETFEWRFLFWSGKKYKTVWKTETYTVPSKKQYVGELFLDIYPIKRNYWIVGGSPQYSGYIPWDTHFGDVDVDIKATIPYNILEASLGTFYSTKELSLDIFDTSTVLFTNGLYNVDSNGSYRSILQWKDTSLYYDAYKTIQNQYLQDLSQMVASPKYKMSIDIRSKDSSIFTLGNIYTLPQLTYPDGSLMEFMCNGLSYNVKENTYRLELMEYIDDDNWRVNLVDPYFTLDPSKFLVTSEGGAQYSAYTGNVDFYYDNSTSWLTNTTVGNYIKIDVSRNWTTNPRDASVYVYPDGLTQQVISIHQDASLSWEEALDVLLYDHFVNYDYQTLGPCSPFTGSFDVSSNSSWTSSSQYTDPFTIYPTYGEAGVTTVYVTNNVPYLGMDGVDIKFYINGNYKDHIIIFQGGPCGA